MDDKAVKRVRFNENPVTSIHEIPIEKNEKGNDILSKFPKLLFDYCEANDYLNRDEVSLTKEISDTRKRHYSKLSASENEDIDAETTVNFNECKLDSQDRFKRMNIKSIGGQEEATLSEDGGYKITPFNLEDEMSYGEFDSTGNFVFKKDENEIKDAWLDAVEWDKISQKKNTLTDNASTKVDDDSEEITIDKIESYKKLLPLLNQNESVCQAIRRYGKDKNKSDAFTSLTEIADLLLHNGDFSAYEHTKESLEHILNYKNNSIETKTDDFKFDNNCIEDDQITWEYKWSNNEVDQVYGPFSTQQMADWKLQGYFTTPCFCRKLTNKVADGSQFHCSDRLDFDLYLV